MTEHELRLGQELLDSISKNKYILKRLKENYNISVDTVSLREDYPGAYKKAREALIAHFKERVKSLEKTFEEL